MTDRCRVIAVNDAVYVAWWADWLHAADSAWWLAEIHRVHLFRGLKTTICDSLPLAWARRLRVTGVGGFDPESGTCRTGNNSGYQAVHCAARAGAKKIILLGFDMDGERFAGGVVPDYARAMQPHFGTLVQPLSERGIDVVNCTPRSKLDCFRAGNLKDELAL